MINKTGGSRNELIRKVRKGGERKKKIQPQEKEFFVQHNKDHKKEWPKKGATRRGLLKMPIR